MIGKEKHTSFVTIVNQEESTLEIPQYYILNAKWLVQFKVPLVPLSTPTSKIHCITIDAFI